MTKIPNTQGMKGTLKTKKEKPTQLGWESKCWEEKGRFGLRTFV